MLALENFPYEIRYNIKILFGLNTIAALGLALVTPLFYSMTLISEKEMAMMGELYLSIIGIILFTYLADLEGKYSATEVVYSKSHPYGYTFIQRFLLMTILTLLIVLVITLIAKLRGGSFNVYEYTFGITITALFLGSLGLTVANLSNEASGYLVSFGYFMFEWFTRGKYTKSFYLNSLLNSSFDEKYKILGIVILLIIINIIVINKKIVH